VINVQKEDEGLPLRSTLKKGLLGGNRQASPSWNAGLGGIQRLRKRASRDWMLKKKEINEKEKKYSRGKWFPGTFTTKKTKRVTTS